MTIFHYRFIRFTDPALRYSGRIDPGPFSNHSATSIRLVFPYTNIAFQFTGTSLAVRLVNHSSYYNSYIGAMIDGKEYKIQIPKDGESLDIPVANQLGPGLHDAIVFKRQDGSHYIDFEGLLTDSESQIFPPSRPRSLRRIEVYGDSVSAGEVSEAVDYTGKPDPEHQGEYSNSWYSYTAITARNLNAELHDIAQGGASLLNGIGWFNGPDYRGMESIYDKIDYNPSLGPAKPWNFKCFNPQVVIVALGQNDSHPFDFMKADYYSEQSQHWRARYADFLRTLRSLHPHALIICATTILEHDASWDKAIDDAVISVHDSKIVHFLYSKNGKGTPGHVRIPEAYAMAHELTSFIRTFGEDLWK